MKSKARQSKAKLSNAMWRCRVVAASVSRCNAQRSLDRSWCRAAVVPPFTAFRVTYSGPPTAYIVVQLSLHRLSCHAQRSLHRLPVNQFIRIDSQLIDSVAILASGPVAAKVKPCDLFVGP